MQIRNLNHLVALLMTMFFSLIIFYPILLASDNKKMDDYFCKDIKKPFFKVSSKNESGEIIIPGRSQGRDFEFLMPKPLGKKRIFIVGGSVAGLMYWPDNSFVNEFVANPEIINCGMGAYDSGRILDVFAEVMDYQPDIVIVLSGNNEVGLETCHGITPEMKRRFQVIKINSKRLFSDYKMKEAEHFVSIKVHEERLRKMAKIAKKKNIPVVFCTLPANMRDFPPFGSLPFEIKDFAKAFFLMETGDFKGAEKIFKTILTERPREPFVHFYLAKALERLKKINEAKRHYQLAIEWDNRADRISQERNEMIRKVAKEEGACLVDLEKSFMKVSKNEIIDGAYIVDGVHWFGKYNDFVISQTLKYIGACENSGGIFKKQKVSKSKNMPEVDLDKVHEDSKEDALEIFHYAIAFIVNEQANGKINERALMMLARVYKRAGNIIDEASQSENALKKYTKQNFWTKQIMDPVSVALWRPGFHHHLAEFFRRRGELNQAKKNIDEALTLSPQKKEFLLTKRLISQGIKKNVSVKDLVVAVLKYNNEISRNENRKLDAGKHKIKLAKEWEEKHKKLSKMSYMKKSKKAADEAIKKYMAGNIKEAELGLKKAIKINSGNIEAQITLCSIKLAQKDFDQALKYCDMAAKMAETPVKHCIVSPGMLSDVLLMRAEIYGHMKEYEKASFDLKKAVKNAPTDWGEFEKAKAMLVSYQRLCLPGDQGEVERF